jgi:hypothetical protein
VNEGGAREGVVCELRRGVLTKDGCVTEGGAFLRRRDVGCVKRVGCVTEGGVVRQGGDCERRWVV